MHRTPRRRPREPRFVDGPAVGSAVVTSSFWRDRQVLVTGHTGFKGAWLCLWLRAMGAQVTGVALAPESPQGVFEQAGVVSDVDHHILDIRDRPGIERLVAHVEPSVVLHLAAQALVPRSFRDPVGTFDVNVTGTGVVLAAAAAAPSVPAVVVVTSDKVYANEETGRPFVETDRLGGGDPYSASKAAAEILISSWRHSFPGAPPIATARAGNVIGGGDQAEGRLLPDVFRALDRDEVIRLRHPESVRPWQHVLEPLAGYLALAEHLVLDPDAAPAAVNFGPVTDDACRVRDVVERVVAGWGEGSWAPSDERPGPEAAVLRLDATLANRSLGWRPRLDLHTALAWTTEWHRRARDEDPRTVCLEQIARYEDMMAP